MKPEIVHSHEAFTLIELMIVAAIIGLLSGMALPKFAKMVEKAQEAQTKGNIGCLRSALAIYYADTEGNYPTSGNLSVLTVRSKYLKVIPSAIFPKTSLSIGHRTLNSFTNTANRDAGGWYYNNNKVSATWGKVLTCCTHKDLKGQRWTAY